MTGASSRSKRTRAASSAQPKSWTSKFPYSEAEINRACVETCAKNRLTDCYVRPITWRGAEQLSVSALATTTHVAIAVWEWPKYFNAERFQRGVRLCWAKYRRPPANAAPTEAKAAGLYMIAPRPNAAERAGYDDALMLDSNGAIAETTGANIFFVRDGALYTPTPHCFLDGIARQTVIALARTRGLQVYETRIDTQDLPTSQRASSSAPPPRSPLSVRSAGAPSGPARSRSTWLNAPRAPTSAPMRRSH